MTSVVLDASAMMAYLNAEPGADIVRAALHDAVMSSVNFSEVLKKTVERHGSPETIAEFIRKLSRCSRSGQPPATDASLHS